MILTILLAICAGISAFFAVTNATVKALVASLPSMTWLFLAVFLVGMYLGHGGLGGCGCGCARQRTIPIPRWRDRKVESIEQSIPIIQITQEREHD